MFSFITAERLPIAAKNVSELLQHPFSEIYNIYVPFGQIEELYISDDVENLTSKLLKSTKALEPISFREMISSEKDESFRKLNSRIALISYTHPSDLPKYNLQSIPPDRESEVEWENPYPYDAILLTLGERILIDNDHSMIRKKLWIYQGKRNFFTEFFVRDLDSLIESGLYGWWERFACKIGEMMLLREESQIQQYSTTWNYYQVACRDFAEKMKSRPTLHKQVSIGSIGVVWILLMIGIFISIIQYMREIIRFDIPRDESVSYRTYCLWTSCRVTKYVYLK